MSGERCPAVGFARHYPVSYPGGHPWLASPVRVAFLIPVESAQLVEPVEWHYDLCRRHPGDLGSLQIPPLRRHFRSYSTATTACNNRQNAGHFTFPRESH